jgi:hypothetical protein
MKRTGNKSRQELKLKQRLELTRTTIRELTPALLAQANAGLAVAVDGNEEPFCPPFATY